MTSRVCFFGNLSFELFKGKFKSFTDLNFRLLRFFSPLILYL